MTGGRAAVSGILQLGEREEAEGISHWPPFML